MSNLQVQRVMKTCDSPHVSFETAAEFMSAYILPHATEIAVCAFSILCVLNMVYIYGLHCRTRAQLTLGIDIIEGCTNRVRQTWADYETNLLALNAKINAIDARFSDMLSVTLPAMRETADTLEQDIAVLALKLDDIDTKVDVDNGFISENLRNLADCTKTNIDMACEEVQSILTNVVNIKCAAIDNIIDVMRFKSRSIDALINNHTHTIRAIELNAEDMGCEISDIYNKVKLAAVETSGLFDAKLDDNIATISAGIKTACVQTQQNIITRIETQSNNLYNTLKSHESRLAHLELPNHIIIGSAIANNTVSSGHTTRAQVMLYLSTYATEFTVTGVIGVAVINTLDSNNPPDHVKIDIDMLTHCYLLTSFDFANMTYTPHPDHKFELRINTTSVVNVSSNRIKNREWMKDNVGKLATIANYLRDEVKIQNICLNNVPWDFDVEQNNYVFL